MTKYTCTLILILLTTRLFAQPVISSQDVSPIVGDTITLEGSFGPLPTTTGGNGANQIWDYSSLTSTITGSTIYISALSTPTAGSFPSANLCVVGTDTLNRYHYFNSNSTSYSHLGVASVSGIAHKITNGLTFYRFPMVYNTSSTEHATSYLSSPGSATTTIKSHRIWNYVGYGTLILPSGTYNNVLKVIFTRIDTQIALNNILNIQCDTSTSWFCPGIHLPALNHTIGYIQYGIGAPVTRSERYGYTSKIQPLQNEELKARLKFNAFPNPVDDVLNLRFQLEKPVEVVVNVLALNASNLKTVRYDPVNTSQEIAIKVPMENMPTGIYLIDIAIGGEHLYHQTLKK